MASAKSIQDVVRKNGYLVGIFAPFDIGNITQFS